MSIESGTNWDYKIIAKQASLRLPKVKKQSLKKFINFPKVPNRVGNPNRVSQVARPVIVPHKFYVAGQLFRRK